MPRKHNNLNSLFQDIANAIQDKNGYDETQQSGKFLADNFPDAIATIDTDPSGDATATANDILSPKTAYVAGTKLTGNIQTNNDSGNTSLNTTTTSKSYSAGYYPNAHGASITLEEKNVTPTESAQSITPTSGKVLSKVDVGAISSTYIGSDITQKSAATYNVSSNNQTINGGQYLAGTQTIRGVTTSGISAANIKSGATVKVGDSADDDRITGVTGTFSASNTITGTGKTAAAAGNILTGKSAFLDGAQLDGTMPNNGATGTTITTQGGTYTIPAGYTSGGTVTAQIPVTTLDNTIISGTSFEEDTGDYGWRSTVTIPAGMHGNQTIVKEFSDVFPAPASEGTSDDILLGQQFYDHSGHLITGTMANNGVVSQSLNTTTKSYTIPEGYHNGSGTVSITTETKTHTPTETQSDITPTSGKVLSKVTVAAIPNNYVGSAITRDPTMTVSGATVTAPSGYYSTAQSKSVATTTHPNPTVSTSLDTTNHKLTLTASHTQGTGYVTGGTTTGTSTITSVPSTTITPTTSSQTAVAAQRYTEGAITVAAIPNQTTGGTKYATSSDQTVITAPKYVTSNIVIKGVTHTATATKIAAGQTVVIGDSADADRIASVSGTFTSDATASAGDIASGKTAYVNGSKITGTGTMASGDATVVDYKEGFAAAAYLSGKGSVAESSGVYTLTSVGTVTTVDDKLVLNLADAS